MSYDFSLTLDLGMLGERELVTDLLVSGRFINQRNNACGSQAAHQYFGVLGYGQLSPLQNPRLARLQPHVADLRQRGRVHT